MEFAAFQFELAAPQEDGVALIEHLRKIEQQTGKTPKALLNAPLCPDGCDELWRTFCELSDCRQWPNGGPSRITYADLDAFQRVSGVKLQAWELDAIRKADAAYLSDWAGRQPKQ